MHKILKADQTNDAGFFRIPLTEIEPNIHSEVDTEIGGSGDDNSSKMNDVVEDVLQRARHEAEWLVTNARKEAQEEKAEILSRAQVAAAKEMDAACASAATLIQEARQISDRIVEAAEEHILALTLKIAHDLLKSTVIHHPAVIADVIKDAVSLLNNEEKLVIHVSPGAFESIKEKKAEFASLLSENASIRILPDQDLKNGDCIVQGQYARIDALLQERFANIAGVLKGASDHDES